MEHDLVIEGNVVRPSGLEELQVGISEGKIAELRRQGLKGSRRLKADGCLVMPGFVDLHVHMREPGWEKKEDFRTGSRAAIHGGVTTVVDMPNNPVPATTVGALAEKQRLAASKALIDVKFYGGIAAQSLDRVREISPQVVAFKIYLARTTGELVYPQEEVGEAFNLIARTGRPVSLHCEDQEIIDKMTRKFAGDRSPGAYCNIRPPAAEVESVKKVLTAAAKVEGLGLNVCHASTAETVSLVNEARTRRINVACEAALHHLYFDRRALVRNPLLKTNPPLRADADRSALVGGLREGKVSFLVTDHAPHTREEKEEQGLSGVPGLDDYAHVLSWLIKTVGVGPTAAAKFAASAPARYAGLSDRGEIEVGQRADIAVLDMRTPEKVREKDLQTKCGWSPYEGEVFPGRVKSTVADGEVLLDEYELVSR